VQKLRSAISLLADGTPVSEKEEGALQEKSVSAA
jgi:hypothetical protein